MSTPYLGELKVISWNFAPRGWAFCNGQLLPINQNQALFALLGTTYGGDGQQTFALPNLEGSVPMHFGTNGGGSQFVLGQRGGETQHTLSLTEMPTHTHTVAVASGTGTSQAPGGNYWASLAQANPYSNATPNTSMNPAAIDSVGGSQPHDNLAPYLVLNIIIALQGIFPSQN